MAGEWCPAVMTAALRSGGTPGVRSIYPGQTEQFAEGHVEELQMRLLLGRNRLLQVKFP